MDTRSKEQLKRDGDYSPTYWLKLKKERGWTVEAHGQRKPKKQGTPRPRVKTARA